MTSSNGNIFRYTGPLCGEFTGHWWIPLTKASDAELWCFLWSASWINRWINNRDADDLRRHHVHYDVSVMHYCHLVPVFHQRPRDHLCMRPGNERRRYIVTSFPIGWAHTQNDSCDQLNKVQQNTVHILYILHILQSQLPTLVLTHE